MRLSGLQKEVLSLYRSCLRESRKKPAAARPHFESFARSEFNKNIKVDKRDFSAIEFFIRKGRRQLELYSSPGIKDKGEPNRRPTITYPAVAQLDGSLSHRAAEQVFRTPLPENLVRERELQRQRRISRKKNGVRVSRRLPSRGTRLSLGDDNPHYLMQVSEFTEDHPYWGTMQQPRSPNMNSRVTHVAEHKPRYEGRGPAQSAGNRNRTVPKPQEAGRTTGGRRQKGMSLSPQNRGRAREKRFGLADPIV
ncbi:hypothetical protein F4806DRAFT_495389 [Annulohypoxylon nitens]|nr:hypothetical protein F4806DRAFT_495389 [Annulohypoxylon nitens]